MDPFILYSLAFVVLYISLYLIFFILKGNCSNKHTNLPPGSSGWPILGENIDMAYSSPEKFIHERMKKHSSQVFKTSLLGEKIAVFCGSSGNKFLFSNENKLVTTWWPQSLSKSLMCATQSQNTVRKLALINRTFLNEILKPENLKQFIPFMDSMARDHLNQEWLPLKEVKVHPLAQKYTFTLACKLFLSIEDFRHVKKLSDPFVLVMSGLFSVPINFPGMPYNRAIKGGKMVREKLMRVIRERKKEMMMEKKNYNDLLFRLMSSSDENGEFMNDEEICNNIVGLLVASYDTTTAAITFVLKYLAELPNIFNEVYKEQMEIAKSKGGGELLNWDDIQKMKYSWNVACEAIRLMPPAQGAFREAITDFTFGGFTIPKGWKTFWNVYSTHKNPKYFPEPERFDPCRFKGSGPAPYSFVPFGGGPRMCPGKEYARLETLVFMHNVVTKFKLEILVPHEKIIYKSSPVPVNGLPIKIQPHEN